MKYILDRLMYWKLLWRKFCNDDELKPADWRKLRKLGYK
jgi:hypothetical protein